MNQKLYLSIAAFGCWALAGCERPSPSLRLAGANYDASSAGAAAMSDYDKNQDGSLSADELKACPGIANNLAKYDADGDGQVSADEISARVRRWEKLGGALLPYTCAVTLDGRPLAGANVELKLEKCLGQASFSATGQTSFDGVTAISIAPESIPEQLRSTPLVPAGLYKVVITHPQRRLPSRYNSATELGCEVSADTADPSKVHKFQLKGN